MSKFTAWNQTLVRITYTNGSIENHNRPDDVTADPQGIQLDWVEPFDGVYSRYIPIHNIRAYEVLEAE